MQNDINPVMRGILVDWLVEVAEEYKLTAESECKQYEYKLKLTSFVRTCACQCMIRRAALLLLYIHTFIHVSIYICTHIHTTNIHTYIYVCITRRPRHLPHVPLQADPVHRDTSPLKPPRACWRSDLYLSTNYVDRFLSTFPVVHTHTHILKVFSIVT